MANREFDDLRNEILRDPARAERLRSAIERVTRSYEASATDFAPGDAPVPVGSVVEYFGSKTPGQYRIIEHHDPADHPPIKAEEWRHPTAEELTEAYPDGVAYDLWPVDLPYKFGFRDYAVYYARRTSFTVVSAPAAP